MPLAQKYGRNARTKALAPEGHQQIRGALAERRSGAIFEEELWRCKSLEPGSSYSNALRSVHVDSGRMHSNRAGNHVVEINRNYRRDIVVGIGIIGVGPAEGGPGQKKHEAKNDTAQCSVRKQKHLCPNPLILRELQLGNTLQNDTTILAEPWKYIKLSGNGSLGIEYQG